MIKKLSKTNLFVYILIIFLVCISDTSHAQISHSPRQTGVEILSELVTKPNKIIVRVESNGCTDKNSFKVDLKKEDGLSTKSPHYVLTILRLRSDECKAIETGGFWITFDVAKDLGLTGSYTYSLVNPIFHSEHLVINEAKIKNYKYYLTLPKQQVQLKDGKFEGGSDPDSYLNVKLIDYAIEDLDGNGIDDAVAILAGMPMGSGSFFEITTLVADTKDDFIHQTNSILLGDRIKVDSISAKSGMIVLKMTVHGPDDPLCCPSQKVVKQFRLIDGKLVPIKKDK